MILSYAWSFSPPPLPFHSVNFVPYNCIKTMLRFVPSVLYIYIYINTRLLMPAWLSMVFLLDLKESTCLYQDRLLTNKTLQPFNDLILKYNHDNSFYGFGFQICMFWNCIGNSKLACDSMCMDACREIQIFFLLVFFFGISRFHWSF